MRSAQELELLQRITARLDALLETDRPRLEAMVRAQHRGDERTTELALAALEEELAKMPEAVLDQLRADCEQETRH
jgi:hypothetical protein